MIFRQLFEPETSTYTYLLADPATREAVLIDPVREMMERDIAVLEELGLKLVYTLETHVHADHVTGAGALRERLGSRTVVSRHGGAPCADLPVDDGDVVRFGRYALEVRATPGHTDGCVTYVTEDHGHAFTGDALLIGGCGRTDFQHGDPHRLYRSIHDKLFTLPDTCAVHPGHDYRGRTVSTIGAEKRDNPRLGGGRTEEEFVGIMDNLHLAPPRRIDEAVPANLACGVAPAPRIQDVLPGPDALTGRLVVDVRGPDEYATGHVPGARLVPLGTHLEATRDWDRDQPIVMVCKSGRRSARAAEDLLAAGFRRVFNLAGGTDGWRAAGLPIEHPKAG